MQKKSPKTTFDLILLAIQLLRFQKTPNILPDQSYLKWKRFVQSHFGESLTNDPFQTALQKERFTLPYLKEQILALPKAQLQELLALYRLHHTFKTEQAHLLINYVRDASVVSMIGEISLTSTDEKKIEALKGIYLAEVESASKRKTLEIPVSMGLVGLDFFLRIVSLGFVDLQEFGGQNVPLSFLVFFLLQFIGIPLLIFITGYILEGRIQKKYEEFLIQNDTINDYRLKVNIASWQFSVMVVMILLGGYITSYIFGILFILAPTDPSGTIGVVVGLLYGAYLWLMMRFFSTQNPEKASFENQIGEHQLWSRSATVKTLEEDQAELEVTYQSRKQKIDAYVIESTLFGALAFSAFLQIMANDLVSLDKITAFTDTFEKFAGAILSFNSNLIPVAFEQLTEQQNLFFLLSVQTLVCSIFFLVVIASRLKFRQYAEQVEYHLNLSKLSGNTEAQAEQQVQSGYYFLDLVKQVAGFMQYFRTVGVLIFFLILISSAFFISSILSIFFIGISVLLVIYFRKEELLTFKENFADWLAFDYEQSWKLVIWPVGLVLVLLTIILKMQNHHLTFWVGLLALFLISASRLVEVVFRPKQTLIRSKAVTEFRNLNLDNLRKISWGIIEVLFYAALFFMLVAESSTIRTVLNLSVATFTAILICVEASASFTKKITVIVSIWFIVMLIHLQFGSVSTSLDILVWVILALLLVLVFFWWKEKFAISTKFWYLGGVIGSLWLFSFLAPNWTYIIVNYGIQSPEILSKLNEYDGQFNANTRSERERIFEFKTWQADWYQGRKDIAPNELWNQLNSAAWSYHLASKNQKYLTAALGWVEASIESNTNLLNLDTKAQILSDLGRKEEAVSFSKSILKKMEGQVQSNRSIYLNNLAIISENATDEETLKSTLALTNDFLAEDSIYLAVATKSALLLKLKDKAADSYFESLVKAYESKEDVIWHLWEPAQMVFELSDSESQLLLADSIMLLNVEQDSSYTMLRDYNYVLAMRGWCDKVSVDSIIEKSRESVDYVSAFTYHRLAQTQANCSDLQSGLNQAYSWVQKAVAEEPENVDYQITAAELAIKSQDWDAAKRHYREALELSRSFGLPDDELVTQLKAIDQEFVIEELERVSN